MKASWRATATPSPARRPEPQPAEATTDASTTADAPVNTTAADRLDQLQAEHRKRGVEIDKSTVVTRWAGERMDYSTAIEWLLNKDGIVV